jgi:hypothetical protein
MWKAASARCPFPTAPPYPLVAAGQHPSRSRPSAAHVRRANPVLIPFTTWALKQNRTSPSSPFCSVAPTPSRSRAIALLSVPRRRRHSSPGCRHIRAPRSAQHRVCCIRELNRQAGDLLWIVVRSFFFHRRGPTIASHLRAWNCPAAASVSIPPVPRRSPARPMAPLTTGTS